MRMGKTLAVGILMLGLFGVVRPCYCGEREMLAMKVEPFGAASGQEFLELCYRACIPCGFAAMAPGLVQKLVRRNGRTQLKGKTVREILEHLIAGPMKGYAWRISGGVLEMLPKDVMDGRQSSVLNKHMPSVIVENLDVKTAAIRICEEARIAEGHFTEALQVAALPDYGKISIHLEDVGVREALNAVVRADGKSSWHLSRNPQEPRSISVWSCRPMLPIVIP